MQQAVSHRVPRPYTEWAAMYDATLGVPFFVGARRAFEELVRRYGIKFRSVVDLGCSTGLFARYLSRRWGISTFAAAWSPAMLAIAMRNCAGCEVGFLQQNLRCLQLPQPRNLVTANFDTLNYLLHGPALRLALQRIYENLRRGGYCIFDLITPCQPRSAYLLLSQRSRKVPTLGCVCPWEIPASQACRWLVSLAGLPMRLPMSSVPRSRSVGRQCLQGRFLGQVP
jgi:SAM-dependent methyltransferase